MGNRGTSRRAFETFLVVLGLIAVVAGSVTVLLGVDSLVGGGEASATIDSEMRFYAVWYVGAGLLLVWSARNLDRAGSFIRAVAGLFFIGGLSRGLSWLVVGEPHLLAQVLMVIEVTLPFLVVFWHATLVPGKDVGSSDISTT